MPKITEAKVFQSIDKPFYQLILVAGITFSAAILRFYKMNEWSFWIDEVWSIRDALALGTTTGIVTKFHFLFYLLLKPWVMFLTVNEWNARLFPSLIGIVTIPILFVVIKKCVNVWVAIIVALLLAVAPWHLYWSQNVRFYTLLLLFYNLSLFAFYWGLEKDNFKYIVLAIILWGLALITHTSAAILVPTLAIYIVLLKVLPFEQPPGLHWKYIIPLAFLPVLYIFYEIFRVVQGEQLIALDILQKFFLQKPSLTQAVRLAIGVVYYIGVPVMCIAFFSAIYLIVNKQRQGLFFLVAASTPFLILFAPVSQTRYVFLSLPMWLILAAIGVRELFLATRTTRTQSQLIVAGLLLVLLADPISQDMQYYFYQNGHRWNWKDAFAEVEAQKLDDDLIVTTWPEVGAYYLKEDSIPMNEMTPEMVKQSNQRLWFIDDGWVNPGLYKWLEKNAELKDVLDVHIPGKIYPLRVYLYDPGSGAQARTSIQHK